MDRKTSGRGRAAGSLSRELPLESALFAPGERVAVAVSGGADSTALLRALTGRRTELGLVLSVVHVEHGLRGAAALADAEFVRELAERLGLPCEVVAVDTPGRVAAQKESVEEAARKLRYGVFQELVQGDRADIVATAHTLDDQAETVLMKLVRGAWTEGLGGIHPVLPLADRGRCVRPLLGTSRAEIEEYLRGLGQGWREDASNQSPEFTRNRVRHQLLPAMRAFNPHIAEALAHVAANARAEQEHWEEELARVLPQLLLPGRPVRGGGRRAAEDVMALDIARLRALDPGLGRRVLRAAAVRCGATLDCDATERLLRMMTAGPKRLELPGGARVERTARELQFSRGASAAVTAEYSLPVPGSVTTPEFGARFTAKGPAGAASAVVRAWRHGDRVEIEHSRGPKKVKEVLERMGVRGEERAGWPVVECQGRIVWMRGVRVAGGWLVVEERL